MIATQCRNLEPIEDEYSEQLRCVHARMRIVIAQGAPIKYCPKCDGFRKQYAPDVKFARDILIDCGQCNGRGWVFLEND